MMAQSGAAAGAAAAAAAVPAVANAANTILGSGGIPVPGGRIFSPVERYGSVPFIHAICAEGILRV